jgi:uncharacterized membrane protein YobD (UPF0266 family)
MSIYLIALLYTSFVLIAETAATALSETGYLAGRVIFYIFVHLIGCLVFYYVKTCTNCHI